MPKGSRISAASYASSWNQLTPYGGYAREELGRVITGDDARVAKLLEAIERTVIDPQSMRALGFCVSVEHADFMARRFTASGLESVALSGDTAEADRVKALRRLVVVPREVVSG